MPASNVTEFPLGKSVAYAGLSQLAAGFGFSRYNPDILLQRKGYEVYNQMATDEQVQAVLKFKRDAILSRQWDFVFETDTDLAPDEQKERIELMHQLVGKMKGSFTDSMAYIMRAMRHGFSVTEKIFDMVMLQNISYYACVELRPKPPFSFYFKTDAYGTLTDFGQNSQGQVRSLDIGKFVHYVCNPDEDCYYGRSELRAAYRSWYMKDVLIKMQALWLERMAGGFLTASAPADATPLSPSDQAALESALANVKNLSGMKMPIGWDLTVTQASGEGAAFSNAIEYHDLAIAKALLVPNLLGVSSTGSKTGSYSQAQTQLEAFFWTLNADSNRLESVLNMQLFEDLYIANFGDGQYPCFRFKPASEEFIKWVVGQWATLVGANIAITTEADEAHLRTILNMPARGPDDKPLVTPGQQQAADIAAGKGGGPNAIKPGTTSITPGGGNKEPQLGANDDESYSRGRFDVDEESRDSDGKWTSGSAAPSSNVRMAIARYTRDNYGRINQALRGGHPKLSDRQKAMDSGDIAALDSAFTDKNNPRTHVFDSDGSVFRGLGLSNSSALAQAINGGSIKAGSVIRDGAFMSTRDNRGIASSFTGSSDGKSGARTGALFEINVPKGTPFLAGNSSEKERIFARGSGFKVSSVTPSNVKGTFIVRGDLIPAVKMTAEYFIPHDTEDHTGRMKIVHVAHTHSGKPRTCSVAAFSRASARVSFSVIATKGEDMSADASKKIAGLMAKAVSKTLQDLPDMLKDPSQVQDVVFDKPSMSKLKAACVDALGRGWDLGARQANDEIEKARKVAGQNSRRVFAALRGSSATGFLDANGFRMAGNLADGARAIIQQQLLQAIKSGDRPELAAAQIYQRLIDKGFTDLSSVDDQTDDEDVKDALKSALGVTTEAGTLAYLNTLTRTNIFESLNEARYAAFTDPNLDGFVEALEYSAILDDRTTEICQALDGYTAADDADTWDTYRPPNHYNCRSVLVPVTQVDGWDGEDDPDPDVEPQAGFGEGEK